MQQKLFQPAFKNTKTESKFTNTIIKYCSTKKNLKKYKTNTFIVLSQQTIIVRAAK